MPFLINLSAQNLFFEVIIQILQYKPYKIYTNNIKLFVNKDFLKKVLNIKHLNISNNLKINTE